ncbi:MAG: sigma-70 family RNA polymerase sigma factor [Phycisphaerae bacterium]
MGQVPSVRNASTIEQIARKWSVTQPAVGAFIAAMIPNFHDAQDVMQEVAAAVFAYDFDKRGWPDSFQAWVVGIARHKVMDFVRRRSASGNTLFDAEAIEALVSAHAHFAERFDDRCEALEHCLKRISGDMHTLLEMRYSGDMSPPEIAARTGRSVSAVKVTLHRVRLALRDCIERRLGREVDA